LYEKEGERRKKKEDDKTRLLKSLFLGSHTLKGTLMSIVMNCYIQYHFYLYAWFGVCSLFGLTMVNLKFPFPISK